MIDCGSLEYAHARQHARHGRRIDEAGWRPIETMRELAALLELARGTALRPWLVDITVDSGAHRIEAVLRGHWRALVAEVVAWMPERWQPALAWCAVLPDLAPLQYLARGGEPVAWMHDDVALRDLCAAPAQARVAVLDAGPLAALASAWAEPHAVGQAWQAEWHRRLPPSTGDAAETLRQLERTLLEHRGSFVAATQGQGWQLRASLHARLSLLLRRSALEPAAAFIHLALSALELERLRAELLRRVLFPRWKLA